MKTNRLFRKYRAILLPEALLRAFLYALSAAAITAFGISLGYHIACQRLPLQTTLYICLGIFTAVFLALLAIRFFPNGKRIAARLDETGLQERAGTMYEYRGRSGELIEVQRKDAIERIRQVKARKLPSHLKAKEFLLCGGCALLAATMLLLPYDLFAIRAKAEVDDETQRQEQIVQELLEELREEVREAELQRQTQKELEKIINNLEEQLHKAETELDRAVEIDKARKELDDTLEKQVTKDELGDALEQKELTRELGKAIKSGDENAVRQAMSDLRENVGENKEKIDQLQKELKEAAEESGVDKENELRKALEDFADDLEKDNKKLDETFKEAEEEIVDALKKQNELEQKAKEMKEALEKAKDEVLGNEKTSGQTSGEGEDSGEGEEGQSGEGEEGQSSGEGEQGGEEGKPGEGEGGQEGEEGDPAVGHGGNGAADQEETMTEVFYDPISGKITYGKVFASYFADYLSDKENGKVPADLQAILDAYFETLME